MTIKIALIGAVKKLLKKQIDSAHLDAEVLLSFILKKDREWLLAHDERELTAGQIARFKKLIARRAKYEPLAYIIGYKEFYGLKFTVSPTVLIPRPETEQLVEIVAGLAKGITPGAQKPVIIDVGTGSGCIGLTLKKLLPQAQILALEASAKALSIARQNAKNLHLSVDFNKSDLLAKTSVKSLGGAILAVNLPYLDRAEIAGFPVAIKRGLAYEPPEALYAKKFGTEAYESLFQQINSLPIKPAYLVAEIGAHHYKKFLALTNKYFVQAKIELKKDLAGRERFIIIKF